MRASEKRSNRYVVLLAVALFAASVVVGWPRVGIMLIAGAAGIQAGIAGILGSGYSFGARQVTGFPARLLGVTAIAFGIGMVALATVMVLWGSG